MLNCINLMAVMRGVTEMLEQGVQASHYPHITLVLTLLYGQSALFVSDDYAKYVICHCSTIQEVCPWPNAI